MKEYPTRIRRAHEADKESWDGYVLKHPNGTPYHLYAWKQAIEMAYGHQTTYLLAEKNSNIIGILPMVQLRLVPFTNQLVGLPFCDVGNCLADDDVAQDFLINQALKIKHTNKAGSLELRGLLAPTRKVHEELQMISTGKVRFILGLPGSADVLFNSFKAKLRSQIRKAEKNGVRFRWGARSEITAAYRVFAKNMHELGSPAHSKFFLHAVLSQYDNRAKLGIVEFEDSIIGMGILLLTKNRAAIPWASTLREFNRLGPNMLLYWRFLQFAADNGYDTFDFGRSTIGEGTYKFKQQWGAEPVPLTWYRSGRKIQKRRSSLNQTAKARRQQIEAFWRKIPFQVATRLGPHLRKHISL